MNPIKLLISYEDLKLLSVALTQFVENANDEFADPKQAEDLLEVVNAAIVKATGAEARP